MVFDAFERMMALRYLRARRKEGFVSVIAGFSLLGIGLGVATLIIVMAVMNGFRADLMGRILGLNGHIIVQSLAGGVTDYDTLAGELRGIPGVVAVTPSIEGQVMVTSRGASSGAMVRGVTGAALAERPTISERIVAGSLADFDRDGTVMIGVRMAQRFGLTVGDEITLISPRGNITAFGTVPRMRAYEISALFDVGMYEYDSSFIYMPLPDAQIYFNVDGAVTHLEIVTTNPDRLAPITRAVTETLGAGFRVTDWTRTNATFFNALQVERNVMFVILTLIIVVAAFNTISGLIMLVKDKGRDIAILRTMGASRGAVMRIFFLAGASVGVVGTVFGVILGLTVASNIEAIRQFVQTVVGADLFAAEIYYLTRMPALIDPWEVLFVALLSLGLSLAATLYPSWRAARLDPVEALRYE